MLFEKGWKWMRLDYVRLLVSDFNACFRFYRDVMGFKATWGDEGDKYASFNVGEGTALALYERQAMAEVVGTTDLPAEAVSQDRMILIFGVVDLDATVRKLRERGARFVTEPREHPEWGIRTTHLRDPDGNLIEINSPMPTTEWSEELREEASKFKEK
jgi:catechol 2,3-dioxygenase-like lactoylglutathione lyase family enzyme